MGKWCRAITSSTSPFISFAVKRVCGYIVIIITIAPRHTICTALFSCMWLWFCIAFCHTQTYSTIFRVIYAYIKQFGDCCTRATGTMYICGTMAACIFYSITYRKFLPLLSFALQSCTAGHFTWLDPHVRRRSGS